MPAESRLRTRIVKALSSYGGYWFVTHQSGTQETGLPDIIGCYQGKFYALEVKRPGKLHTVSKRQSYVHQKIKASGGECFVVTSVDEALNVVFSSYP